MYKIDKEKSMFILNKEYDPKLQPTHNLAIIDFS